MVTLPTSHNDTRGSTGNRYRDVYTLIRSSRLHCRCLVFISKGQNTRLSDDTPGLNRPIFNFDTSTQGCCALLQPRVGLDNILNVWTSAQRAGVIYIERGQPCHKGHRSRPEHLFGRYISPTTAPIPLVKFNAPIICCPRV